MSRLDAAVQDVKTVVKNMEKPKSQQSSFDVSKILHDLNEYLFDLFDANCMEDYHKMEAFESRAMMAFMEQKERKDSDYDLLHYQLHQEFLQLFEQLIEKFLAEYHCTSEDIFHELERYKKKKDRTATDTDDRAEILDVLCYYTDFPTWAKMMNDNAQLRLKIQHMKK
jgi:hypothetical protein